MRHTFVMVYDCNDICVHLSTLKKGSVGDNFPLQHWLLSDGIFIILCNFHCSIHLFKGL